MSQGVVQRAYTFTKCVFKLDAPNPYRPAYLDQAVVVTSASPTYDNPWDSVLQNGKPLRVWILQEGTHAPVILQVDALEKP
jgi:hypothetical protein